MHSCTRSHAAQFAQAELHMHASLPLTWPGSPLPSSSAAKLQRLGTAALGNCRIVDFHGFECQEIQELQDVFDLQT